MLHLLYRLYQFSLAAVPVSLIVYVIYVGIKSFADDGKPSKQKQEAERKRKEERRREYQTQCISPSSRLNTFEDYKRAMAAGQTVLESQYLKMRSQHLSAFRPRYPARILYPVLPSNCPLHRIAKTYSEGRRCHKCYAEFNNLQEKENMLPPEYREYANIMDEEEWRYLRMQDKHAQLGELTEDEARINKHDFIAYFAPLWKERIQARADRAKKGKEESQRQEPAKPIW